jgi:type IV fimbrial biogenesis protein FimT
MRRALQSRCPRHGFTLAEVAVAIALLAILATLAVPSFGNALARHRLKAAAEHLAHDLAEARADAEQRGVPRHVSFERGARWCYAVSAAAGCGCHAAAACALKTVDGSDHPGVALVDSSDAGFQPDGAGTAGAALLQGADGAQLRVGLTRLGRPSVCTPGGAVAGVPAC